MRKNKKQVIIDNPEYKTLINAVISRVGIYSVEDINRHGIRGGFGGFIYYSDTIAFAHKHRKMIIKLLEEDADSMGTEVVAMVSNFGAFRSRDGKSTMDEDDRKDLYRYLSGVKCKEVRIPNLMAWYAAETVCRWFDE